MPQLYSHLCLLRRREVDAEHVLTFTSKHCKVNRIDDFAGVLPVARKLVTALAMEVDLKTFELRIKASKLSTQEAFVLYGTLVKCKGIAEIAKRIPYEEREAGGLIRSALGSFRNTRIETHYTAS